MFVMFGWDEIVTLDSHPNYLWCFVESVHRKPRSRRGALEEGESATRKYIECMTIYAHVGQTTLRERERERALACRRTCRDRSSVLPGEGVDDIKEGKLKFYMLRGREMKNKEHYTRGNVDFLLKSWRGYQNTYRNLRGGMKILSNIWECLPPSPKSN